MPVFEQTYRSYEGSFRSHFRWFIILQQELRVLMRSRIFIAFLLVALLHVILRLLQLVAYDVIVQDPNNPLSSMLRQWRALVISERTFFDFIRIQAPLVLIVSIYAGSGMICNDAGNNLMEVFFSKPLSWRDYLLGKLSTLLLIGFGLTAFPALVLLITHNLLLPRLETFTDSLRWLPGILGFSAVITIPCALAILASSALLRSQNYASIALFMILVANHTFGVLMAGFLRNHWYAVISFPLAQNHLGEVLFQVRPGYQTSWMAALGFVVLVSGISLAIVAQRVRRAEIPA